ncbi:hypothetical protein JXB12_12360 [candidate division KSB1 bacterium]|nr:hypothetical protein [candidate division KSB1 bacterium]
MRCLFCISVLILLALFGWFNRYRIISYAQRNTITAKIVGRLIPRASTGRSNSFIRSKYEKKIGSELELAIDMSQRWGKVEKFWSGIGMDSFNEGILAPINKVCIDSLVGLNLNSAGSFRYVRTCGIYADRKTATKEDIGAHVFNRDPAGRVTYYWRIVDAVCDELVSKNLKPIIALTYMPDQLASIENHRNPWNLANISPPQDYEEWRDLVYETVRHLRLRYGTAEISQWYFEVWNEPDYPELFWIKHPDAKYKQRGHNTEYFKLYDYAVAGALAAEENIKIGGPVIAGDMELFIKPFIHHCENGENYATGERGTRLDFISRHHYGEVNERILPRYYDFIDMINRESQSNGRQYEIIISECGPSTLPQEWLNTRYVAAWIIKSVDGFYYLNDQYGNHYLPDITCFWTKPVPFNFNNHFGLMVALGDKWHPNPNTIVKRPAFNAFDMLSFLHGDRLKITGTEYGDLVHGLAAIDEEGDVTIIIYHLNEWDKMNNDRRIFDIHINLSNLSSGAYRIAEYQVNENNSNGYQQWRSSGSSIDLRGSELTKLKQASGLNAINIIEHAETNAGEMRLNTNLQNNSVVMLRLESL